MGKSVLVVEDDQFLRDLYNELLTGDGYDVTIAADGEEGLNKISVGGFDLVLLDIMLPKMDGLEILRKLRVSGPKVPNGPVILLTNLGQDSIIKEGFSLGATGYIIKSAMTPEQVLDEVKVFTNKG